MGGPTGSGGAAGSGSAGAGGFMGGLQAILPMLQQGGSTEQESLIKALSTLGPPPPVQSLPTPRTGSAGGKIAELLRPRSPRLPQPVPTRGEALTNPNAGGVGGALMGGY